MLKVAVFSDTHNNPEPMRRAIRQFSPDAVIHCGDGVRDIKAMEREFPAIPFYYVSGNCDFSPDVPLVRTVELDGVRIFIAHGHTLGVKYGDLDRMGYAARESGATVACYGHSHIPLCRNLGSVTILNPGSAGLGLDPTWGMLEIEQGHISWHLNHVKALSGSK